MSDIKLPPEVVEAAARVLHANAKVFPDIIWDDLGDYDQDAYREEATAALIAGLKAWPESKVVTEYFLYDSDHFLPAFILPLPQEAGDT